MDEWTIKTPTPICRLFFIIDLLTDFAAFYRLEISFTHGWYFRPSLWTVAPMDRGTILAYCCPSTFSLNPPPPQTKSTVYSDSVWLCVCVGGGGVELCFRPYSAGVLHSVSDQVPNLQNYFTTPNKIDQLRRHLGIGVFKVPSSMPYPFLLFWHILISYTPLSLPSSSQPPSRFLLSFFPPSLPILYSFSFCFFFLLRFFLSSLS